MIPRHVPRDPARRPPASGPGVAVLPCRSVDLGRVVPPGSRGSLPRVPAPRVRTVCVAGLWAAVSSACSCAGTPDLHGTPERLRSRLSRRRGHFFPAGMLDSQLADLEEPDADEHPPEVEIDQRPEAIVDAVLSLLYQETPQAMSRPGWPHTAPHSPRSNLRPPARRARTGSCATAGNVPSWSSSVRPYATTRWTACRCWTDSRPTHPSPEAVANFSFPGPTGSATAATDSTERSGNSRSPNRRSATPCLEKLGLRPFHLPIGVNLSQDGSGRATHSSVCIRCNRVDGFPCLVSLG